MKQYSDAGKPIYPTCCKSWKGKCDYYTKCGYIKQYNTEWDVLIYATKSIGMPLSILEKEDAPADYLFIDESCYQSLLSGVDKKIEISRETILKRNWQSKLQNILYDAPINAPLLKYIKENISNNDLEEELSKALDFEKWINSHNDEADTFNYSNDSIIQLSKNDYVYEFIKLLKAELSTGRDYANGIIANSECFQIYDLKNIKDRYATPAMLIDADLNEIIYKKMFPNGKYIAIQAIRKLKVYQSYSKRQATSFLKGKGAKDQLRPTQQLISR